MCVYELLALRCDVLVLQRCWTGSYHRHVILDLLLALCLIVGRHVQSHIVFCWHVQSDAMSPTSLRARVPITRLSSSTHNVCCALCTLHSTNTVPVVSLRRSQSTNKLSVCLARNNVRLVSIALKARLEFCPPNQDGRLASKLQGTSHFSASSETWLQIIFTSCRRSLC